MKKRILFIALVAVLVLCSVLFASCGESDNTDYTKIETFGMTYENGEYKLVVSPETDVIDLSTKFKVSENASYELYSNGILLSSATVSLENGSNVFSIKIWDNNSHETTYKLNVYRKQIFTVSFNTNGGTSIDAVSVEEGKTIEAPNAFKLGHNFDGWDFDFANPITSNVTANAIWSAKSFKITFDINGEKNNVDLKYGDPYKAPEVDLAGFNFTGWLYKNAAFDKEGIFNYTENIEVFASLQPIEYSIIYVVDAGCTNPNTDTSYTIISNIDLLDAVWANDEKVFVGWYTDASLEEEYKISSISNMTGAITLYPKFKDAVITKTIQFSVDGELVDAQAVEFTFKQPYEITFIPEVDEFHKFEGWYFGDTLIENKGDLWLYKADMTLTAKITAREYDIEYVLNGGVNNSENPNKFNADQSFALLDPTYGNHEFAGWYTDSSFTNKIETISVEQAGEKLTIYAKWNERYLVKFDYDGGEGEEVDRLLTLKSGYKLTKATKNKYVFSGWYYGDIKVELEGVWEYNTDVTLKAKWIPVDYVITYILNGGIQNEANIKKYNADFETITLYDPTWENNYKKFAGWYLEPTFDTQITEINPLEYEGITLYAKWEEIKVDIILDSVIGHVSPTEFSITVGSNYNLPIAEHASCKFLGWEYDGTILDLSGVWTIPEEKVTLIAKWEIIEYNISYELDGGSAEGLVTTYTSITDDIVLPKPTKEGYTFIGWITSSGGVSDNVIIPKGSFGDRSYTASWYKNQDDKGFYYELRNGVMVVVGFDMEIDTTKDRVDDIYIPAEYYGYKVTSIEANAFKAFGEKFINASYTDDRGKVYKYLDGHQIYGFTKIFVSSNINHIGANAFESCYGIKVQLYSATSDSVDHITWDKGVTYELGNVAARDCIWGFRPALGWSRYSLAEIPDDYE